MQRLLRWLLVLGIIMAMIPVLAGCARKPAQGKLQILFSGNMRGNAEPCGWHGKKGGLARRANFYKKAHDADANWLTVDAGNFLARESGKQCTPKCDLMVQSYRAMKYDVLSLGQSDLWLGYDELKGIIDTSGVPVVCANLVDIHTRKPIAKPYEIRRYGKMVIGVTGFIGSKITWRSAGLDTTRLTILPYLEVMQSLIPRLDAKTDAIVLLCDLGTKEIDSLLQIVPQIDVVISTGPLVPASQVTRVRGALCVPTGSSGQYGTAITVEFNPAWGDSLGYTFTNVELADEYEAENEVSSLIASWKQSSSAGKGAIKPATPQPISSTPAQGSPIQLEEVAPKPEISLSPTRPEK